MVMEDILIMDSYGNARYIDDWNQLHNRAFTLAICEIQSKYFILLQE